MATIDPWDHVGLVVHIARRIRHQLEEAGVEPGNDLADLISAGCLGLLEAVPRFDPQHGVKFSTFAAFRIQGAIWDSHYKEGTLIPLSRRCREQLAEVNRAREQLRQRLGQEPASEQLAEALDITPAHLQELENCRLQRDAFEKAEVETQERGPTPEEEARQKEQQMQKRKLVGDLDQCIKALPLEERVVVVLLDRGGLTLQEVAQVMGVSKDVVHRRHRKARAQLRACLGEAGWDVEDIKELTEVDSDE